MSSALYLRTEIEGSNSSLGNLMHQRTHPLLLSRLKVWGGVQLFKHCIIIIITIGIIYLMTGG
jgi:hypothetical protein